MYMMNIISETCCAH